MDSSKSIKKIILISFLVFFIISSGLFSYQYFRLLELREKVEQKKDLMRKDGMLLTLSEVQSYYDRKAVTKVNAAMYYQKAYSLLAGYGNKIYEAELNKDGIPDVLAASDNIIQLIEEGNKYSCHVPLEFAKGASLELPHLSSVTQVAKILSWKSLSEAKTDIDKSIHTLQVMNDFLQFLDNEPIFISFLVNFATQQVFLDTVLEIINKYSLESTQLAKLEELLPGKLLIEQYLYCDIASTIDVFENPKKYDSSAHTVNLGNVYQYTATYYQDYLSYLDIAHESTIALRQPFEKLKAATAKVDKKCRAISSNYHITNTLMIPPSLVIEKYFEYIEMANIVRAAIYLEHYHRDHNRYPDSLSSLVPDYTQLVPENIHTGKPLSYKLESENQYTLYSFGLNGLDDGGKVKDEEVYGLSDYDLVFQKK